MFFLPVDAFPCFQTALRLVFFPLTVSFLTPLSSCSWARLSWSASPGFTHFSSVTKEIVFSFLLEESHSSTAGILAKVNLSPCLVCYFSRSPGCCVGVPPLNLHISALPSPGGGHRCSKSCHPLGRVLLTGFSAGTSLWEQDCTTHRVHAELEQGILPCWVLPGLTPGTAPLLAVLLAAHEWFSLCLITARDMLLLFTVCTNL